ncbi:DMT family transporter [Paraglaciecola aquimarina]|uniref:DMT family transporter n=1 Tax=Paraglaciecola algarum TaxID=3050085 RepID=A0ABS9D937_9ALTE|nr:DMT family transporter [Paraglaciecola sp. G1-23]MCF2949482.1 DMT family transporter [Paraglaciecola sp. G1-23]
MAVKTVSTTLFTLAALFAFAANSVLCRLALNVERVDPISFTAIRLISAAAVLLLILSIRTRPTAKHIFKFGSVAGAFYLFVYAAGFSFAYITLNTATGALALFACVQFTMLFHNWLNGNKLTNIEKIGVLFSLIGFAYFVYPELGQPSLLGCLIMGVAGIAWGMYSLIGAKSNQPLLDTSSNFIRLMPISIVALCWLYFTSDFSISPAGLFYTLASGVLASGLGYAVWYYVLPKLPSSLAAVSQLSVPIWAALGGVMFVGESISLHLIISSCLILGGILLILFSRLK